MAQHPYRIERRTKRKGRAGKPLSGYALDITIRANGEGSYFLHDHNYDRTRGGPNSPHTDRVELIETLVHELNRNHREHFGHS